MAKDDRITSGKNYKERLDSTERYLQHIKRRLVSKVGAAVPPVPVSDFCEAPEEDGTIMRYMFPSQGRVRTAAVFIDNWESESKRIGIVADVANQTGSFQRSFELKNQVNIFEAGLEVVAGSRLQLRLSDPSEKVFQIWIAFVYSLTPHNSDIHKILVDELEKIE